MNAAACSGLVLTCVGALAADAIAAPGSAIDILPAPGGAPIHVRISATSEASVTNGPVTADIVIRRTSAASAVLQRGTDITPLDVAADGTLKLSEPMNPNAAALGDVIAALNTAHAVLGASGAGNHDGWTAQIPMPSRPLPAGAPAPAATPSPEPPLAMAVHEIAPPNPAGIAEFDGAVETTLEAPQEARRPQQRSRGFGGSGGFGGRGFGRGGNAGGSGDDAESGFPRSTLPPVILDVHVTGRLVHDALSHLTIEQTRRIVIDGLTYTNAGSATIDVVRSSGS